MTTDYATDIPLEVAVAAHYGTSFIPETRGEQERRDYADTLAADYGTLRDHAEKGGTLAVLDEQFTRYRLGFRKRYLAKLSAQARCLSPMITGPARFPGNSNRKRCDSADNRRNDLSDFRHRAMKAIVRTLRPDLRPIMSSDSDATIRLGEEIKQAEALQEKMKLANRVIRSNKKGGESAQVAALVALGFAEASARELLRPDFCGRIGFADYALTNNGANIRRLKKRLEQVAKNQEAECSTIEGPNCIIEDDPPANRVRLIFSGKPSDEIRAKLKARGFRWSPSAGAWQSYRNRSAMDTAKQIAGISH